MAYNLPSPDDYDNNEVYTFPNGMIDLITALEAENKGKIKHNVHVVNIVQRNNHILIKAYSNSKKTTYKAKKIICTTPAPIAVNILRNSISENALNQLSKIDYGQYLTINIFTQKRWLHEAWTVSCLDNYFTSIYDVTRTQTTPDYEGKSILSAYIPSTSASDKEFINQNDTEVFKKTIKDLELYFPAISKTVIDYDIQRFQYAYPVFGLGYYAILKSLNTDKSLQGNIFLAGDYMKYPIVDGAVLSGYSTALKVNKKLQR